MIKYLSNLKKYDFAYLTVALAVLMLGLSYIAVPLYQLFCQTYGFGGTVQKISYDRIQDREISDFSNFGSSQNSINSQTDKNTLASLFTSSLAPSVVSDTSKISLDLSFVTPSLNTRSLTINFSAEQAKDLPWLLKPSISKIKVYPGDTALTFYYAQNLSSDSMTGVATYNIVPAKAGLYFNKIQCFCFEEQRLKGNECVELPVLFFLDSDFLNDPKMNDLDSITLSYTFFKTLS